MLKVSLPGRSRQLELKKLLLDLNGTLTVDGVLENGVKQRVEIINNNFEVYLLTADTRGRGSQVAEELGIQLFKVSGDHGNQDKLDFLNTVGAEETVMIGNGFNDSLVLEQAGLSIAVIGKEGASFKALHAADIVVTNILDALDLLIDPMRIIATLRG